MCLSSGDHAPRRILGHGRGGDAGGVEFGRSLTTQLKNPQLDICFKGASHRTHQRLTVHTACGVPQ